MTSDGSGHQTKMAGSGSSDMSVVPVQIEWGDFRTLSSVYELAECLMHNWQAPVENEAYTTALMVCAAVLGGSEDDEPSHARAAFIDAAYEAGLSVAPEDLGPDF